MATVPVSMCLVAHFVPHPRFAAELGAFGNGIQAVVLLLTTLLMIRNGLLSHAKTKYFWYCMALGCGLWLSVTVLWMWFVTILRRPAPQPFIGDVLLFIHIVPMMAALSIRPHRAHSMRRLDFGSIDFAMLLLWWLYLYAFMVLPWQYVKPDVQKYLTSFNLLYTTENGAFLVGLLILSIRVRGSWRKVYVRCLAGAAIYLVAAHLIYLAIGSQKYYNGSIYDVPKVLSMCVFLFLAIDAHRLTLQPMSQPSPQFETAFVSTVAMLSVLSIPVIAAFGTFMSDAPAPIVMFRLKITTLALVVLPACVFLKQQLLDHELVKSLGASQRNLGNLKRLQGQLVQAEKLSSLGELVAGAAHQISNPLTAIIGYSDLLEQDFPADDEHGSWIRKIGQQARRTQELLKQMLKFSKQEPSEKLLIDLNRVIADAVELRELDLEDDNVRIVKRMDWKLPHLWGDSNQLLQVFFHIIGNAVDAMQVVGGGTLTVTTRFEGGMAVAEFSDTGTGVADPQKIFDPFYTTKPVGKGAGLGLSAAYGIVTNHGGTIVCHNRPEGGASFILRFPITYPENEERAVESAQA